MAIDQTAQSPHKPIKKGSITVDYLRRYPTISVEQAAELLGVSRAYGYDLVKSGRLGAIMLSEKRIRVKSAALLRMLGED
jgi:excisionase family DNA binding protein